MSLSSNVLRKTLRSLIPTNLLCFTHRSLSSSPSFGKAIANDAVVEEVETKTDGHFQARKPSDYACPQDRIRNFAIIAHIDHGKSTLADRLLELTGAIPKGGRKQYLDRLPVERARGITVKAQSAALLFTPPHAHTPASAHAASAAAAAAPGPARAAAGRPGGGEAEPYLLNLIDTPGHVDFSYEVARALGACQAAVLLVDATQGVQAQTLATFYAALDAQLTIVPVINKVDMPLAEPERVAAEMVKMFGVEDDSILRISAKTGLGVPQLLAALVERVPPPEGAAGGPLRALLLDSHYDSYRGAISIVQVVDGSLGLGDRFESAATGEAFEALEVGLLAPEPLPLPPPLRLGAGQVGYLISNARSVRSARVGDTLRGVRSESAPLAGFVAAKPMVFQGLFPASSDDYEALKAAVERLCLNDPSVVVSPEKSQALGPGFNAGFLGLLHADVFHQRLREEYGADVIATVPTVPYRAVAADGAITEIRSPAELPDPGAMRGSTLEEPMVNATIMAPKEAVGALVQLCVERRGVQLEHTFIDASRALLRYKIPMGEIATDFADVLKSRSTGYASFDYEPAGFQPADIVRLDVLINGEAVDALASLCHRERAQRAGRGLVTRLKELLGRQMFDVAIQAAIGGKVIARESLSAMRKNVLAKCYGGDVSRKRKLLDKQKAGKAKMKRIGSVEVPHEIFSQLLRSEG